MRRVSRSCLKRQCGGYTDPPRREDAKQDQSRRPNAPIKTLTPLIADFINTIDPKRTRRIGTEAAPLRSGRDCSSNVFDPISDCAGSLSLMRWESNIRYTQRSPASPTKRRVEFRQPFRENLASSKT